MQYAIDIVHNGAINIPPELSRACERYPVPGVDGADGSGPREAAVLTYETIRSVQEIRER